MKSQCVILRQTTQRPKHRKGTDRATSGNLIVFYVPVLGPSSPNSISESRKVKAYCYFVCPQNIKHVIVLLSTQVHI